MRFAITLDPRSDAPLQRQIYGQWRQGILSGRFRAGERVPSTRDLAASLGIARSTVTAAYDQLIAEGYLTTLHGAGTFVCRELPDALLRAPRARSPKSGNAGIPACALASPETLDAGTIRFSHWRPDLNEFPFPLWRRLLNRHMRSPRPEIFSYADEPTGYTPLREEIAAYVGRSRAVSCSPDQILIVSGSQQALDLCARVLLQPGDLIAIENPCYQGAREIFDARGVRLHPVPLDPSGIAVDRIPAGARAVYVTPSHQFPTGVSMTVARRLELIDWARRTGALILEDDYDSEYRYSGSPLPAMQGLTPRAPVVYIGTFSKVMFPALRIGYLIAPPALVKPFARAKWITDRHNPTLDQAALADFLREGHLERHIRRMRRLYGRRREVLVDAIHRHFGSAAECLGDDAGMHLMIRLNDPNLIQRAEAHRVRIDRSAQYYLGDAPPNEFVFGFSNIPERTIREGIKRLAAKTQ